MAIDNGVVVELANTMINVANPDHYKIIECSYINIIAEQLKHVVNDEHSDKNIAKLQKIIDILNKK